jgi:integrase
MARRGKGEGSLRLRPDGRWEARLTLDPVNGRRQRRSIFGRTRGEVAKKLREAQARIDSNQPLPPEGLTLASHLATWIDTKKPPVVRPETWRRYNELVAYITAAIGSVKLQKLTVAHIRQVHAAFASQGLSRTTAQHAHGVLHAAIEDAVAWDVVARNVASLVPAPRRSTPEMKYLRPGDARDLVVAAVDDP